MFACQMSVSTPLHRLDPELKILHAPRQLKQLAENRPLGLQTQSRGFPGYQSSSCHFCSVNPKHKNVDGAMSSHSHAPNSRNTSCCPKFQPICAHRGRQDTAMFLTEALVCFWGPSKVAAVIRTKGWQLWLTPHSLMVFRTQVKGVHQTRLLDPKK